MDQNYARKITPNQKEPYFPDELNQNNNELLLNPIDNNNKLDNEEEEGDDDDDDRLIYTLITLDLGNLIHIFEDNNITFVDMLLLTKEDMIELQLEIFQRNRILNFSKLFTKFAKSYSIKEISDFFTFNKQFIFNSSIYDKVVSSNINENQNERNNEKYNTENNWINSETANQEANYINTELNNRTNNNITKNNIINKNKGKDINGGLNIKKPIKINKKTKNRKDEINYDINKNEEFQKIIEKIGMLESTELNNDLYEKLNLIKNYINMKGDKMSSDDLININNDIESMIKIMNNIIYLSKSNKNRKLSKKIK